MTENRKNLKCFSENRHSPGAYVARRIYLGSVRPALNCFGASFRRFSRWLKYLATTLSHLIDRVEMVVASGSLGYLKKRRPIKQKEELYTDAKKISKTELEKS